MSELTGARQVILITSKWKEKEDITTIAWHMPTSFTPPLYAISLGKKRYSNTLISKSKCFCINFMPFFLKREIIYCGSVSGKSHNKFQETGLEKVRCDVIDCIRIKQAIGYAECEVIKKIDSGDHDIFIGKIVKSELISKDKRLYHIEGDKFKEI